MASAVASGRLTELGKAVATNVKVRLQVQAVVEVGVPSVDREYQAAVQFLDTLFHVEEPITGNTTISKLTLESLGHRCRWWTDRTDSFDQWVAFAGWRKDVSEAGFTKVISELIQRR